MNIRNVLRAYTLQRQLTDDETALLNTLRSLSDPERELLVESLSPSQKKAGKKSVSKSSGKTAKGRCQAELVSGATCNMLAWHGIHDAAQKDKYVESHEFLPSKSSRASGMAAAISRSLESSRKAAVADDDSEFQ